MGVSKIKLGRACALLERRRSALIAGKTRGGSEPSSPFVFHSTRGGWGRVVRIWGGGTEGLAAPQRRRRRRQDAAPRFSGCQRATHKVGGKAARRLGAPRRGAKEARAANPRASGAGGASLGAAAGGACAAQLPREKGTSAVAGPGRGRKTGAGGQRGGRRRRGEAAGGASGAQPQ